MIKCGKPNCTACPHGPYLYVRIRHDGQRRDVSLGSRPSAQTFYQKLAEHLDGEQIMNLIREWREQNADEATA
jgi:hypothetical protein